MRKAHLAGALGDDRGKFAVAGLVVHPAFAGDDERGAFDFAVGKPEVDDAIDQLKVFEAHTEGVRRPGQQQARPAAPRVGLGRRERDPRAAAARKRRAQRGGQPVRPARRGG